MNPIIKAIIERRSVRKYKPDMVTHADIEQIIKAGTYAATGHGSQSPIIIAVTDKELISRLSKLNAEILGVNSDPFYGAPVILIVLADKSAATHVYDGSLVMGNLMLAAHSLNLGSCWINRAKETFEHPLGQEILQSLGLSKNYEGIGFCIIGYTDGEVPKAAPRKNDYVYYID